MILFVPSTGFQSSATFPVAWPGGSRTPTGSIRSAFVTIRGSLTCGRLKHLSTRILWVRRAEVLPAAVLQRDRAALLGVEPVPALPLHLPDHGQLVPLLRALRLAVLLEQRVEPVRCRSEEHTSELQSPYDLVCRLLLE